MECSCHTNVVVTIFYLVQLQFRITWKKHKENRPIFLLGLISKL